MSKNIKTLSLLNRLAITILVTTFSLSTNANTITLKNEQQLNKQGAAQTLTLFHQAAANANLAQYFNLLTENAIYLGTDANERWTKTTFKEYVEPLFKQGHGWLYSKIARNIILSEDGQSAFFDELLSNKNYGLCRSTGLLLKTPQGWKIAQYSLSVPLPNAIAKNIIKQIQEHTTPKSSQFKTATLLPRKTVKQ